MGFYVQIVQKFDRVFNIRLAECKHLFVLLYHLSHDRQGIWYILFLTLL
jgi:hypothetical protein